jgi:hypothetical protein
MKPVRLFEGVRYVGEAEGDKRTYYIFETDDRYLVVGPTRDGYYMNLVDREAPAVISKAFAGQKVTTKLVTAKSRRPDIFPSPLATLNALYAMVALRRARKLKQRQGRSLVFKIS